jgi:hypothetical protein
MGYKEYEKRAVRDLRTVEKGDAEEWYLNYLRAVLSKAQHFYALSRDSEKSREVRQMFLERATNELTTLHKGCIAKLMPCVFERFSSNAEVDQH